MKMTMQNIREMKPATDNEMYAYKVACERFAELGGFDEDFHSKSQPNFKQIYKAELAAVNKAHKSTKKTASAV